MARDIRKVEFVVKGEFEDTSAFIHSVAKQLFENPALEHDSAIGVINTVLEDRPLKTSRNHLDHLSVDYVG